MKKLHLRTSRCQIVFRTIFHEMALGYYKSSHDDQITIYPHYPENGIAFYHITDNRINFIFFKFNFFS